MFPAAREGSIGPAEFRESAWQARSHLPTYTYTGRHHSDTPGASLNGGSARFGFGQPGTITVFAQVTLHHWLTVTPQNDPGPRRAFRTLRPRTDLHLAPAKGPLAGRVASPRSRSSSHPETGWQVARKKVIPGAAAPTVTWKWLLRATRLQRVDHHHRCTRTVYGRWVSRPQPAPRALSAVQSSCTSRCWCCRLGEDQWKASPRLKHVGAGDVTGFLWCASNSVYELAAQRRRAFYSGDTICFD